VRGAQRSTVEDGAYTSNPIARAATLAGVTLHMPYDSTLPAPSTRERVGFMVGAILTPAAGIYVGPTAGWRGFSITVGLGTVWVETTPDDKKIGDAVVTTGDQLVHKPARMLMIGGSYVFGG
jgi:hypothetical protein